MKNKTIKKVVAGLLLALTLFIGGTVVTTGTTDPKDPPPQGTITFIK